MGLIYREQEDINAGVEIVTIGKRQYFDISKAVNNAVYNAKTEFKQHAGDTEWFRSTVGDKGKWNIKQSAEVWSKTLGISQNSYNKTVLFYGRALRMDDIGNITYGYLGKASGYPNWMLTSGSMLNHIKNHGFTDFQNEQLDEQNIMIGINWYNGIDIRLSW